MLPYIRIDKVLQYDEPLHVDSQSNKYIASKLLFSYATWILGGLKFVIKDLLIKRHALLSDCEFKFFKNINNLYSGNVESEIYFTINFVECMECAIQANKTLF